jgi:thiol-disulfide isomerase/thioredoxin
MKKSFILSLLCLVTVTAATAQNYEALSRFMTKYSSTWAETQHMGGDFSSQIGTKCPDYYLNKKYNSKKLRGKFVLMNFWATWCSGCRLLSEDLDTLMMRRYANENRDVQLLGIDCQEAIAYKGFDPDAWWKSKGILFPTISGQGCEDLYTAVKGTHPCMLLVDDKGIIRGRWDAWTPSAADEARMAVWALHVVPRDHIQADSATVEHYIALNRPMEAVYLMSLMPDELSTAALRFKALDQLSEGDAIAYLASLRKKYEANKPVNDWEEWKVDPQYTKSLQEIVDWVYRRKNASVGLLQSAYEASRSLLWTRRGDTGANRLMSSVLRYRYADGMRNDAVERINTMVNNARSYGLSDSLQTVARQEMAKWNIPVQKAKVQIDHADRMEAIEQETNSHLAGLTDNVAFQLPDSDKIKAVAQLPQKMLAGHEHCVEVEVTLDPQWHAYPDDAQTEKEGFIPTKIELKLPKGFTPSKRPMNTWPKDNPLTERFVLQSFFNVPAASKLKGQTEFPITVSLTYQICNSGSCLPPKTVELKGTMKLLK